LAKKWSFATPRPIRSGWAVDIENAVIRGPFTLKSIGAERDISIKRTTITDPMDWSYATFKGVLTLTEVIFEKATDFTAVTIEKDIVIDKAIFKETALFRDLQVAGVFYGRSLLFEQGTVFERANFAKDAFFTENTILGFFAQTPEKVYFGNILPP
jgi:hypothetical protein